MKLAKNPNWTWRTDLAWLFYHLPRALLWWLRTFIISGFWRKSELGFWDSLGLTFGMADEFGGVWCPIRTCVILMKR